MFPISLPSYGKLIPTASFIVYEVYKPQRDGYLCLFLSNILFAVFWQSSINDKGVSRRPSQ